mmetsp:Transcript_6000/g.14585  ORF Transcript_6000/g.14585 Transcript_6000/m.14585 type:complete len:85 (+) Transcript_6000:2033-2287(+)
MGDFQKALKWYNLFCSRVPTDPGILARMGALQSKDEDEAGAFHYHQEVSTYPCLLPRPLVVDYDEVLILIRFLPILTELSILPC